MGLFLADRVSSISGSTFIQWGHEILLQIENDLAISGSDLFAHSMTESFPDYAWGQGVMFHALCAAAKLDSQYLDEVEALAQEFHNRYWCYTNGIWGYNATADMCGDRYYDDNAWLALVLLELYEITGNNTYLDRGREVVNFSMSGENPSPQSGIRWHEGDIGGTSVCSIAPTILANLMIYQATWIQQYYDDALRLWNWMTDPQYGIQDAQVGLFHQGLHADLSLNGGYLGYQTAVPLQAALRFYQITGQANWLTEARHLATSMETHFINSQTHALTQTGQWGGHDMTNAYVELYFVDYNQHWLDVVAGYLTFLHDNCRDYSGRYPEYWHDTTSGGTKGLMNQATVARAYWKMASTSGGTAPSYPVMIFKDCDYGGWSAGFDSG